MRAAWLCLLLAPATLPPARAAGPEPVVVRVFAYAPAPTGAAESGEEIFRRAGVPTRWKECTPARGDCEPLLDGEILLKVVRRPWINGPARSSFGAAVLDRHSYLGWVFEEHIEEAARANEISSRIVVAYVMAHEVAHLLGLKHSEKGIMHCEFSDAEIRSADTGALKFTSEEMLELQAAAAARRHATIASLLPFRRNLSPAAEYQHHVERRPFRAPPTGSR
jgi:hypothetical protein